MNISEFKAWLAGLMFDRDGEIPSLEMWRKIKAEIEGVEEGPIPTESCCDGAQLAAFMAQVDNLVAAESGSRDAYRKMSNARNSDNFGLPAGVREEAGKYDWAGRDLKISVTGVPDEAMAVREAYRKMSNARNTDNFGILAGYGRPKWLGDGT